MRTLNRPMFRTGGSTGTGITSGLAPRQGYAHEPGHVVQNDPRKLNDMRASDLGKLTIGQMKELSRSPKGGGSSRSGNTPFKLLCRSSSTLTSEYILTNDSRIALAIVGT